MTATGSLRRESLLVRALPWGLDLLALQRFAPQRYPCLLESAAAGGGRARHDLLLGFPQGGLRLDPDGVTRRLDGAPVDTDFCAALDADWRAASAGASESRDAFPFRGGWALFLGYELAAQIEPRLQLPEAPGTMPTALALRCPVALLRDHDSGQLVAVAEPQSSACLTQLLDDVDAVLAAPCPEPSFKIGALREPVPQPYLDSVRQALRYIAQGDVFQVNLARSWSAEVDGDQPWAAIYQALRRANPAPFAGCFQFDDWAVMSSSPERLVSVHGEQVQTRPIAGTRPRFPGDDDAARMRELVGNPKERAEHIMLIDLERNDLGRVCVAGSVEVDELMSVESYTHVHHIESNVRGRLRPGTTPGSVIRATFPGGTITGCPKVRCMQIIAELEATGRGPYTGAIGYLNLDGDMDLNILIRTLWTQQQTVRFSAGAGVVADSDPEAELGETRDKARGLLRALGLRD